MRFGLVGSGWWARRVHGRGLASCDGVELVGVWGRRTEAAGAAAAELGVAAFPSFAALVAAVDAVAFAVPPDVQAALAVEAAAAGRHLLLEKPIATSTEVARGVAHATGHVATAVFVTSRYDAGRPTWLEQLTAGGPWHGAQVLWLGAAFADGSPFDTPWRRDKGALWDIGPHMVAMVEDALGPVRAVASASHGPHGFVSATLDHGDARSTVTATLEGPPSASRTDVVVWGPNGALEAPARGDTLDAYRRCARQLVGSAEGGPAAAVDVAGGLHLVEVLTDVEAALATTRPPRRRTSHP